MCYFFVLNKLKSIYTVSTRTTWVYTIYTYTIQPKLDKIISFTEIFVIEQFVQLDTIDDSSITDYTKTNSAYWY